MAPNADAAAAAGGGSALLPNCDTWCSFSVRGEAMRKLTGDAESDPAGRGRTDTIRKERLSSTSPHTGRAAASTAEARQMEQAS